MEGLTIEKFGKIVDDFLNDNHIQMIIEMEEGTRKAIIEDNTGMGSVIQFYILMHGMAQCMDIMMDDMEIEKEGKPKMVDGILEILKNELLSEEGEE